MNKHDFWRARIDHDLTFSECADALGADEESIRAWQSGHYRIPGWVDEQFREMRVELERQHGEIHARREAIERRYAHLSTQLYLGEVPVGWLTLLERLLQEVDDRLPEMFKGTAALDLSIKEKWGSLRLNPLLDCQEDLEGGMRFLDWLWERMDSLETESEGICARCGSTHGVAMTTRGWRLPLCGRHRRLQEGDG